MSEAATQLVPVEDLDTFVAILSAWHEQKVAVLEHMMHIPDGSEVQVNDGAVQVLSGEYLTGFMLGVSVALMELGTLPFLTELPSANLGQFLDNTASVQ